MRIDEAQRRARLARRHMLAAQDRADDITQVADGLVALHATNPSSVFLSALVRMRKPSTAAVEQALYDDRSLVRVLGMRRTVFVVPRELAPVVQAACTDDVAARERRRLVQQLTRNGHPEPVPDAETWLATVMDETERALRARGSATTQQLAGDVPSLRQKLLLSPGKKYESLVNVAGSVVALLAAEGRIVRGRPRGSWLSSQYVWEPMDSWLGDQEKPDPDAARAELARRWLGAFGPAQVADLKWWTGWTMAQTRKALAAVGPVEVELDCGPGIALPDDLAPVPEPELWVALLPELDPTAMGWAERSFYVGEHRKAVFDGSGNVCPTVWADGRIVGVWGQRPGGEIVYRLLTDVGADVMARVDAEVARLGECLGDVRAVPKFPTPLARELTG